MGSAEALRFHLTRERIHQSAVSDGVLLSGGVGYLGLTMNRENSAAELEQEVTRLVGEGMKSLVLDLRANPGGLRDEAVQAADLFLDPEQRIKISRIDIRNCLWRSVLNYPWPAAWKKLVE